MALARKKSRRSTGWSALRDPDGQFSSGIPDLDRVIGGGFRQGSFALLDLDETVDTADLDLLLFPTILNMLYHSRGVITVLPSRDSPAAFRARLTEYVTRRRFDARVRIVDYVGEAARAPYVVHLQVPRSGGGDAKARAATQREVAKMVAAEAAVQGGRKKAYLELSAFEIPDTEVGPEVTARMVFHGVKRSREAGNLVVGLLAPGVGASAAIRRMADTELALHREDVGLTVRGLRPRFGTHLVLPDPSLGPPHVVLVPGPA